MRTEVTQYVAFLRIVFVPKYIENRNKEMCYYYNARQQGRKFYFERRETDEYGRTEAAGRGKPDLYAARMHRNIEQNEQQNGF